MNLKYRPEIDGLRALAVVPVILFHAGFDLFSGGFVGVDVFFVISGYLITAILIEDIENKRFSLLNFYEKRARRILPALFFVMLVCIPFAWMWMLPSQMEDFSQSLVAVSLFASNILFWKESDYFDAAAEEKPLLHTWSLAVEEQYYVLFPIFLFLAWRYGKNRVFWMIVVMASLSLLLSEWGWRNKSTANFYLAPARAWELFAGSIAAFIVQKRGVQKNNVLSLLGLAVIVFSIFAYDKSTPFPSIYALVPVLGVVLLVLYADKDTLAAKILSMKVFVGVGLISYSAYLWHQPLFAFAKVRLIDEPSTAVMAILSILSIGLAVLTWKYVEHPFRNRTTVTKKNIFIVSIVGMIVFITIGLIGHKTKGYSSQRSYLSFVQNELDVSKVSDERQIQIRAGICHFNKRGKNQKLDSFLEDWSCLGDDESLKPTGILIIGDSHSADKAVALRENGYDVYQIGGAGCALSESFVTRNKGYCKDILRKAHRLAESEDIKAIFISNRFEESELSVAYLNSILEYWSNVNKPILLWSPMPNFERQLAYFLRENYSNIKPNYSREEKFFELLDQLIIPSNIMVIKTSEFWCPKEMDDDVCASFSPNRILMSDEDHLGLEGARIFGARVIKTQAFKSILQK